MSQLDDYREDLLEDGDGTEGNLEDLDEDALLADDFDEQYQKKEETQRVEDEDFIEIGVDEDLNENLILENGENGQKFEEDSDDGKERDRFKTERKLTSTCRTNKPIPETLDAVPVTTPTYVRPQTQYQRRGARGQRRGSHRGHFYQPYPHPRPPMYPHPNSFQHPHPPPQPPPNHMPPPVPFNQTPPYQPPPLMTQQPIPGPNIHVNPHFRNNLPGWNAMNWKESQGPNQPNYDYGQQQNWDQPQPKPPSDYYQGGGYYPPEQNYYNGPNNNNNNASPDFYQYSQSPQYQWDSNYYPPQSEPEVRMPPPAQQLFQVPPPRPFFPMQHRGRGFMPRRPRGTFFRGPVPPMHVQPPKKLLKSPLLAGGGVVKNVNRTESLRKITITEIPVQPTAPTPTKVEPIEEEDEEMRNYRKKIEEQKKLREELLRQKEEKRKIAAMQKSIQLEAEQPKDSVESQKPPENPDLKTVRIRRPDGSMIVRKLTLEQIAKLKKRSPNSEPPTTEPKIVSRVLQIDGLSASTTSKQLEEMANSVGSVLSVSLDSDAKRAVLKLTSPSEANAFINKYHRRMIDLSWIAVKLVPDETP